ncbi:hypothetical protein HBI81_243580 [Parastagonospora nodorum]|nr:hypothetical protein HBI81_243580 [Parastagonospora nodorum]
MVEFAVAVPLLTAGLSLRYTSSRRRLFPSKPRLQVRATACAPAPSAAAVAVTPTIVTEACPIVTASVYVPASTVTVGIPLICAAVTAAPMPKKKIPELSMVGIG